MSSPGQRHRHGPAVHLMEALAGVVIGAAVMVFIGIRLKRSAGSASPTAPASGSPASARSAPAARSPRR